MILRCISSFLVIETVYETVRVFQTNNNNSPRVVFENIKYAIFTNVTCNVVSSVTIFVRIFHGAKHSMPSIPGEKFVFV